VKGNELIWLTIIATVAVAAAFVFGRRHGRREDRMCVPRPAGVAPGRWTAVALALVLLAVEAVIVAESWRGLTGFANLIGISGVAAWGVPVTLDGVSLVAALVALRAELAGESSGLYRVVLFVFTTASAAANWWHAQHADGTEAALYLGGMSVAVAVVFALALRQIRHEDRRRAGTVTGRLPRFSLAHWVRYPGLTWRAWSLAVRDGHTSPRDAMDAALDLRHEPAAVAPRRRWRDSTAPRVARHDRPSLPAAVAPSAADVSGPDAIAGATPPQRGGAPRHRQSPRSQPDTEAEALAVLSRQPGISGADLGRAIGVSPRTGQRLLAQLGAQPDGQPEST
jgi:Protein of unknown function (DUF2637)